MYHLLSSVDSVLTCYLAYAYRITRARVVHSEVSFIKNRKASKGGWLKNEKYTQDPKFGSNLIHVSSSIVVDWITFAITAHSSGHRLSHCIGRCCIFMLSQCVHWTRFEPRLATSQLAPLSSAYNGIDSVRHCVIRRTKYIHLPSSSQKITIQPLICVPPPQPAL
jgi:hypothetical protein